MRSRTLGALALVLVWASVSRADLVPSLDGTLVYDTDRDITWLADANYHRTQNGGLGILSYPNALAWVAALEIGGYSEWRLPTTQVPDSSCTLPSPPTLDGCTGSEMGHLFYVELGGTADEPIWMSGDPDVALFENLDDGIGHWSETTASATQSFLFRFYVGYQNVTGNTGPQGLLMWPVHPGNITGVAVPPVPAPAFQGLGVGALLALTGLWQLSRRR